MTKHEMTEARVLAKTLDTYFEKANEVAQVLAETEGRVYLAIEDVAALVAYQALQLDGTWDVKELSELMDWFRYKVVVI